jgi:hypothetical protein
MAVVRSERCVPSIVSRLMGFHLCSVRNWDVMATSYEVRVRKWR